jgi:hypothetical protein
VFVRTDLPLPDQIVQVGHVCLEAGGDFAIPAECRLVALAVPNRQALLACLDFCRERGIRTRSFVEPDAAGEIADEPMGLTTICTEPLIDARRKHLRRFHLWSLPKS